MVTQPSTMTTAEWEVMRIVWTADTATSTLITGAMARKRNWSASTTKTLLGRLVAKRLLTTTKAGRRFIYHAAQSEAAAMNTSVATLFSSLCARKKGTVITDLVANTTLAQADIAQLQALLAAKFPDAPATVACDCMPDDCHCPDHATHHTEEN